MVGFVWCLVGGVQESNSSNSKLRPAIPFQLVFTVRIGYTIIDSVFARVLFLQDYSSAVKYLKHMHKNRGT